MLTLPLSDSFGQKAERAYIMRLQDTLKKVVDSHGLGQLDGDEWGKGEITLFFYGPDADRLMQGVEPVLRQEKLLPLAKLVKRYGDRGSREIKVSWDREGKRIERAVRARRQSKAKKAEIGDVLELRTPRGLAYVQYTHRDDVYGEVVRVLEGVYNERPSEESLAALVAGPSAFHAFVFLQDALKQGVASVVRRYPIPPHASEFPIFRDGLPNPRTRRVEDWVLWDGERQWPVGALTAEQRKLPLRRILTGESLGSRIARGWKPDNDIH